MNQNIETLINLTKLTSGADWKKESDSTINMSLHKRISMTIERTSGQEHWDRAEILAEQGIHIAQVDSANFAKQLREFLKDELTIRNLQNLVKEFQEELDERLDTRIHSSHVKTENNT